MRNPIVARNYAEALLAVAKQENAVDRYGDLLDVVAGVVESNPAIHAVMMSPRVTKAAKAKVFAQALKGTAPAALAKFLGAVVQRGRQDSLGSIAEAYRAASDVHFNRVHASVTTAHEADEKLRGDIAQRIEKALGRTVLAHYSTDPALIGGVIVRVGDRAFDGSVRRKMQKLREKMLTAR